MKKFVLSAAVATLCLGSALAATSDPVLHSKAIPMFQKQEPAKPAQPQAQEQKTAVTVQGVQAMIAASRAKEHAANLSLWAAEQAEIVIDNHVADLNSMWLRSWRPSGISTRYHDVGVELEKIAKEALVAGDVTSYRDMLRWSASYKQISQLICLGGKEAVNDGTGDYTTQVVKLIESTSKEIGTKKSDSQSALAAQKENTAKLGEKLFSMTNNMPEATR